MSGITHVLAAAVAFVGMHVLLSHPLRAPLVRAIGEKGFLAVYSLVAAATLAWVVFAYRARDTASLWAVGDVIWAVASAVMLVAFVLLIGSLVGNPALPGAPAASAEPRGMFAITRHPMMWSFALWALVHVAVYPLAANIVVAAAILVLALVGAGCSARLAYMARGAA